MTTTADRLTDSDRHIISRRIGEVAAMWQRSSTTGKVAADPSTMLALVRTGANAIGLTRADLRDTEEEWIVSVAWETVQRLNQEGTR